MKASQLREKNSEQLQYELNETIKSLFNLRLQAQSERLNAPSELLKKRRLIARIKTILREREIESQIVSLKGEGEYVVVQEF